MSITRRRMTFAVSVRQSGLTKPYARPARVIFICFLAGIVAILAQADPCHAQRSADSHRHGSLGVTAASPASAAAKGGNVPIRIATFNIRMFPCNENCECMGLHGYTKCVERGKPTTDLRRLADTIITLKPDILAVNEILNPERLARFAVEHLGPDWRFVYAQEGGRQKVGFLFNSSVVRVLDRKAYSQIFTTLRPEDHSPFCFRAGDRLRPAFACRFQALGTGFDFYAVVLHLKPRDCSSVRIAQWKIMEQLVDELAKEETEIVILGDFNDYGRGEKEFSDFCRRKRFTFITESVSCTHSMGSSLDNILVSDAMLRSFHRGSARVGGPCAESCGRTAFWRAYLNRVSDHCPVVAEFRTVAPE